MEMKTNNLLVEEIEIMELVCNEFLVVLKEGEINKYTVKSYVNCIYDTAKEIKRLYSEEYGG
jgi:hypothetical protein